MEKNRKDYTAGGYRFVECEKCGERYNAGRPENGAGLRYVNEIKDTWWAKHNGKKSNGVIVISENIKPCRKS